MKKKLIAVGAAVVTAVPLLALAQTGSTANAGNLNTVSNFINNLLNFANNTLVPALFAVIFLYFAYAMYNIFVKGGADAGAREKGTSMAINAVIGVVLILSFWGIVNLLASGFGFTTSSSEIRTPGIVPSASTRGSN